MVEHLTASNPVLLCGQQGQTERDSNPRATLGIVPPGELVELGIVQAVPIVGVPWFDTRQTCKLAHDYLAGAIEGRFEEYHS